MFLHELLLPWLLIVPFFKTSCNGGSWDLWHVKWNILNCGYLDELHLTASIKDLAAYIKHSSTSSNMWPFNPVCSVISGFLLCQLLLTGLGIQPHVCTMVIHVWACGLSPAELTKGHILTHTRTHAGCGGRGGKQKQKGEKRNKGPSHMWYDSPSTRACIQYSVNRLKESELL